jgi:organic radical activating enzyme
MKRFFQYLLYRFRFDHPLLFNPKRKPVHLHLELNATCNSKCTFCYRQSEGWKDTRKNIQTRKPITSVQIKDWLHQAFDCGIRAVKLNWRGEPTLSPAFEFAVKTAQAIGYLDIRVNTNGQVQFPRETLRGITNISYSVDAADGKEYERLRFGCSWMTLINNIAEAMGLSSSMFTIQRAANDDKHNEWEESLKNLLKVAIVHRFKDQPARVIFALTALGSTSFKTRPLENRMKPVSEFTSKEIHDRVQEIDRSKPYCLEPFRAVTVGFDGAVWSCPYAYNEPDNLFYGVLHNTPLNHMLADNRYRNLLLDAQIHKKTLPIECLFCPSKTTKGAGC